jgi:hypothetical protein
LYGLEEVERVEALEQQARALSGAFLSHFSQHAPKKLEEAQRSLLARLRANETPKPGMAFDELATFPGMPGYRKGPVS